MKPDAQEAEALIIGLVLAGLVFATWVACRPGALSRWVRRARQGVRRWWGW